MNAVPVHVYFIQMGDGGPIKIGLSANVQQRLDVFQLSAPYPLTLLAVVRNGRDRLERELHARFASARLRGEWFQPVPELLSYIRDVAAQPGPSTEAVA